MAVVDDLAPHVDRGPEAVDAPARRSRWPARPRRRTTAVRPGRPGGGRRPRPTARVVAARRSSEPRARRPPMAMPIASRCRRRHGPRPAGGRRGGSANQADSMSTASAPVAASSDRRPPPSPGRARTRTGPVHHVRPGRRSSPARRSAAGKRAQPRLSVDGPQLGRHHQLSRRQRRDRGRRPRPPRPRPTRPRVAASRGPVGRGPVAARPRSPRPGRRPSSASIRSAATTTRSAIGGRPQVAAEGGEREHQPVEVVVDVEVARESPVPVNYGSSQVPSGRWVSTRKPTPRSWCRRHRRRPGGQQGEEGPGGLRGGGGPPAGEAPGRRRSAGPRPSRRRRSGAPPARRVAGRSPPGDPGSRPAATRAGTAAPVP